MRAGGCAARPAVAVPHGLRAASPAGAAMGRGRERTESRLPSSVAIPRSTPAALLSPSLLLGAGTVLLQRVLRLKDSSTRPRPFFGAETVYFNESCEEARLAVNEVLDAYHSLLHKLSPEERGKLQRYGRAGGRVARGGAGAAWGGVHVWQAWVARSGRRRRGQLSCCCDASLAPGFFICQFCLQVNGPQNGAAEGGRLACLLATPFVSRQPACSGQAGAAGASSHASLSILPALACPIAAGGSGDA